MCKLSLWWRQWCSPTTFCFSFSPWGMRDSDDKWRKARGGLREMDWAREEVVDKPRYFVSCWKPLIGWHGQQAVLLYRAPLFICMCMRVWIVVSSFTLSSTAPLPNISLHLIMTSCVSVCVCEQTVAQSTNTEQLVWSVSTALMHVVHCWMCNSS